MEYSIQLNKLSLLTAIGCNLKCEYCSLDKAVNPIVSNLMNNTINALENGEYLENVLGVIEVMDQSPRDISDMELWGQEPTLNLPYLAKHWKDWYDAFPNMGRVFFSTNAMDNMDAILYFIDQINKYCDREMRLEIQVSYDGKYGTNIVRGADSETIRKNCIYLVEEINKKILKDNFKISIFFHGVVSNRLIKEHLRDFKETEEYVEDIDFFLTSIEEKSMNKHLNIGNITIQYENGNEYSSEEGIELANTIRRIERLRQSKKYKFLNRKSPIIFEIMGGTTDFIERMMKDYECESLDDFIDYYIKNYKNFPRTCFCAPGIGDLKIMYDGTLLTCQNQIYDTNITEDDIEKSILVDQARLSEKEHNHIINPLTATKEELEIFLTYSFQTSTGCVQYFMISEISNLIYVMSQIGQVDKSYSIDLNKLKRHAFYLSFINTCYYNLIKCGGSSCIRNTSEVRLLCNGALDIYDEELKYIIERNKYE